MSTDDHPSPESLVLFADRGLSSLEEEEVAAHLDTCPDCALEIAMSAQLRDLQSENLIPYPGPARREAAAQRLRELILNPTASGSRKASQALGGTGAFDPTALLGGAIGFDALAHLSGPATTEAIIPVGSGLLGDLSGAVPEYGGEEAGRAAYEASMLSRDQEIGKNVAEGVRNDEAQSSRSAQGDDNRHGELDALIEEASALFLEVAEEPMTGQVDETTHFGEWYGTNATAADSLGQLGENVWQVADVPDEVDPTIPPGPEYVEPDSGHGQYEDHDDLPHDHGPSPMDDEVPR
jgi:hypothetical protein